MTGDGGATGCHASDEIDADDVTIETPPIDVHIVDRMRLLHWVAAQPIALPDDRITAIY